jgi:hypothetical protein
MRTFWPHPNFEAFFQSTGTAKNSATKLLIINDVIYEFFECALTIVHFVQRNASPGKKFYIKKVAIYKS